MVKDIKYIIKRIIVGVSIALIIMLIKGGLILNVQAQSGSLNYILGYRGYTSGNYSESNNVRQQIFDGNIPYTIFGPYQNRTVWGIRLLADFSNIGAFNGSTYQNKLDVYFKFNQSGANNYWNNSISASATYVSNLENYESVSCSLSSQTSTSRTYHCSGGFTNYEYPTTVNFVVGNPNNYTANSDYVSTIDQYTSIDIGSITYSTSTMANPDSANINDIKNNTNNINNGINNINNTLTNSNVNSANDYFSEYIEDFDPNTHGLTRIILAPLQLIDHLLSAQCTSLTIPLPFVNQNITLPCMSTIYTTHFNTFLTIYRLITDGIIGYWVCVNVFRKFKGFLDPTDDKVEVFDL